MPFGQRFLSQTLLHSGIPCGCVYNEPWKSRTSLPTHLVWDQRCMNTCTVRNPVCVLNDATLDAQKSWNDSQTVFSCSSVTQEFGVLTSSMSACLCNSGEFWQKPLGCLMSAVSSKPNEPSTSVDRPATSTSATTVWWSASFAFRSSANFKGCGTTIFTTCRLFMLVTRIVNSPTFQKCKADPCQSCSIRIVPCWGRGTCGTSSETIRQVVWQAQWFSKCSKLSQKLFSELALPAFLMPKGSLTQSHVGIKNVGQLLTTVETLLHMKSANRDQFQWTLNLEMLTNTDTPDSNGINATEIHKLS